MGKYIQIILMIILNGRFINIRIRVRFRVRRISVKISVKIRGKIRMFVIKYCLCLYIGQF